MKEKDNSNFQGLVSGISADERQVLLDNIKKNSPEEPAIGVPVRTENRDSPVAELITKYRSMSLFQRIWFKLKSVFTNVPVENIVNAYYVKKIGNAIESEYSGLVNCRKQILLDGFYDRLMQLKLCCDFFAPLMYDVDSNPDAFYVLLGTIVMPEVSNQISSEADPYQYPFTKEINNEMRASLIHKMDMILDSIPIQLRTVMYASVRSVEWLRQFVKLPFDKFLSKFTEERGGHQCQFSQVTNEMAAFAKLFDDCRPVTEEILQALHTRLMAKNNESPEDNSSGFLNAAQKQLSVVTMFNSTVPMLSLSRVVFDDSTYTPDSISGGEDWLVRYKSQQKVIFDRKWARWLHDYKKNQTKAKLASYFSIQAFPPFPSRPWERIWGSGVNFAYAYTSGFMYYFFKSLFPDYSQLFKIIALEGDFSIKENRLEFTDSINEMNHICDELDILSNQMGKAGEYGQILTRYQVPEVRSKNTEEKVNSIISAMEKDVQSILNDFGKVCRSMDNILLALDGEKITAYYGPLTNMAHIQGNANKEFRENLARVRKGMANAYEIVKEIEALDKESAVEDDL